MLNLSLPKTRLALPGRLWREWVTPHATTRDEAFRENTIRITTGVMIVVLSAALLLQLPLLFRALNINNIGYTFFIALMLGSSLASAVAINNNQITRSGYLLTAGFLIPSMGLAFLTGVGAATVIPEFILAIIIASLVLPRQSLVPITATGFGLLLIVALLQISGLVPPLAIQQYSGPFAIVDALFFLPLVVVYLRQLRVEFDNRLGATMVALGETQLARQEAEQATKAKSQFLANMSHELRTPLNAIIGYTEIMLGGMAGDFTDEQKRIQSNVDRNARRLLGLINDILDLSRIEVGRVELRPEPLSPQPFLTELTNTMQSIATKKGLTLGLTIGPNTPLSVTNDVGRLQQVVVNLLGNALKFTKQGKVEVLTDSLAADTWEIKVRDSGIGISAEALPKIFDVFQQADITDTRPFEGTGLGLAIVKTLIEHMQGTVDVQSTVGVGSTFTITLPRTVKKTNT